jgi:hypothetical protein
MSRKSSEDQQKSARSISAVLQKLADRIRERNRETVMLQEVVEAFGAQSFGPLILVPAILALLPVVGGIQVYRFLPPPGFCS